MSAWRAIVMLFTLKCDHATHLVSDSFERDLTRVERWALRLHQLSCSYCRRLAKQLKLVHSAARRTVDSTEQLPADAKERIATAISAAESRDS